MATIKTINFDTFSFKIAKLSTQSNWKKTKQRAKRNEIPWNESMRVCKRIKVYIERIKLHAEKKCWNYSYKNKAENGKTNEYTVKFVKYTY